MPVDEAGFRNFCLVAAGGIVGAALVKGHYDETRKSQAEKDDPDGVKWLCDLVRDLLNDWRPREYPRENDYTRALFRYLERELPEDVDIEMRTATLRGIPDILIDDRLVLELKVNPEKDERDRLIGQCCGYSREWVTWAIVIGMPQHRVRELEELLEAKSLSYIEVIDFS